MPRLTIAAGDDRALGKSRRDFRARVCSSLENAATYRECLLLSLSLSLSLSLDRSIDRSLWAIKRFPCRFVRRFLFATRD